MTDHAIISLFEGVITFIEEQRQALQGNGVLDTTALDERVGGLVQAINALPVQQRVGYQNELENLQQALSAFQHELLQKRDEIRNQLGGVQAHRNANVAYRQSDKRDHYKPDEE